jgi:hypothetical protein
MRVPDYTVSTHDGQCPTFVQNVGVVRAPTATITQLFCGGAGCELDRNTGCATDADCSSQGKGRCTGICINPAYCSPSIPCPAGSVCAEGTCTGSPPASCLDDAECGGATPVCKGAARFVTPALGPGDTSTDYPTPDYPKCYNFPDTYYFYTADSTNKLPLEDKTNNVGYCVIVG